MNRKETQLLVENWRKVLDEGLYDHDPEILEEINLKRSIGLLLLALTATTALTPNQASAKFNNIPARTQMQALKSIESAVESGEMRKSNVEDLIKLGARIQSNKNYEASDDDKEIIDSFSDKFVVMYNDLCDKGEKTKLDALEAKKAFEKVENRDLMDRQRMKASQDLSILLDEMRDILNQIKALDSISSQFNFETKQIPDGFEETYSMIDKMSGKIKAGGSTQITGR